MKEYFPHDYNARTDPKLQNVMMELGVAGIGIYWCVVEQLYEQGGKLPLKGIKGIAFNLHVDTEVVERLVKDFDLFDYDEEEFWSGSAVKRVQRREDISEARREAGRIGGLKKAQNSTENEDNHSKSLANSSNCLANANATPSKSLANSSKEKEKENIIKLKEKEKERGDINIPQKERAKERAKEPPFGCIAQPPPLLDEKFKEVDWGKFLVYFNKTLEDKIPKVQIINTRRMRAVQSRISEFGKQAVYEAINKVAESKFLLGENDRNWRADFDWIFSPINFPKILEGNYDNAKNQNNGNKDSKLSKRRYTDVTATCPEDYTEGPF